MKKKLKRWQFTGWTAKTISPCWTIYDELNLAAVIERNCKDAIKRFGKKRVAKVKVKIEVEKK